MHIKLMLLIFMTRTYSKPFIKKYLLIINIYKIALCNNIFFLNVKCGIEQDNDFFFFLSYSALMEVTYRPN